MNREQNQSPIWVICERGDRWYEALCRFAPTARIERVPSSSSASVQAIVNLRSGRVKLLWELSENVNECLATLERVSQLRIDRPAMLQLAWMPSTSAPELAMIAREAGVGLLLSDLAQLQRIVEQPNEHSMRTS